MGEEWIMDAKTKWTRKYSWHKQRLGRLQSASVAAVSLPAGNTMLLSQVKIWLDSRKVNWRIVRRKQQKKQLEQYLLLSGRSPSTEVMSPPVQESSSQILSCSNGTVSNRASVE